MLWDLNDGKHLYTLQGGETINALVFSPNRYWLCAATGPTVKVWVSTLHGETWNVSSSTILPPLFFSQDLESKSLVDEIHIDPLSTTGPVDCMSLAWSADGQTLFAGYTDALIRVYDVDTM